MRDVHIGLALAIVLGLSGCSGAEAPQAASSAQPSDEVPIAPPLPDCPVDEVAAVSDAGRSADPRAHPADRAYAVDAQMSGGLRMVLPWLRTVEAATLTVQDSEGWEGEALETIRIELGQMRLMVDMPSLEEGSIQGITITTPSPRGGILSQPFDPESPIDFLGLAVGASDAGPTRREGVDLSVERTGPARWVVDVTTTDEARPDLLGLYEARLCIGASSPRPPWAAVDLEMIVRTPVGDLSIGAFMTSVDEQDVGRLQFRDEGHARDFEVLAVDLVDADPVAVAERRLSRDWPDLEASSGQLVDHAGGVEGSTWIGIRFGRVGDDGCVEYLAVLDPETDRFRLTATGHCGLVEAHGAEMAELQAHFDELRREHEANSAD